MSASPGTVGGTMSALFELPVQTHPRKRQHDKNALLADLNTEPRTTYLAALRNPNPELETA